MPKLDLQNFQQYGQTANKISKVDNLKKKKDKVAWEISFGIKVQKDGTDRRV